MKIIENIECTIIFCHEMQRGGGLVGFQLSLSRPTLGCDGFGQPDVLYKFLKPPPLNSCEKYSGIFTLSGRKVTFRVSREILGYIHPIGRKRRLRVNRETSE